MQSQLSSIIADSVMCACFATSRVFKEKRGECKNKRASVWEAGHLGAERSFSTNIVAHTLHLPPTRTNGEKAKGRVGKTAKHKKAGRDTIQEIYPQEN